ncbi:MAG: hypothetical protein WCI12_02845 [Actinomycetes bacterium]
MANPLPEDLFAPDDQPRRRGATSWALVIVATGVGLGISLLTGTHIALAGIMIPIVIAAAWSSPSTLLLILLVWSAELGMIRRLTPGGGNIAFSGDPVLIIAPLMVICLVMVASGNGAFRNRSPLASTVLAFNGLAALEVLNPAQGSFLTGIGGLLFMLVPTLAFWVGRSMVDDDLAFQIVWTVAVLGLLAALYGLFQQFVGFPSWDKHWIETRGYGALNIGNRAYRAFGTMSSGQDYAGFLGLSLVAWVCLLFSKKTRVILPLHVAAIVTIGVAIFFESERSIVFLAMMALGAVVAASRGAKPASVAFGAVLGVILLVATAGAFGGDQGPAQSSHGLLAQHQVSGLASPTGADSSLQGHFYQTKHGVLAGFTHPLGHGVGSVTLAASRFNADTNYNTSSEYDPGNLGEAFGVAGVLLYALLLLLVAGTAYRVAVRRRDAVGLFVLGAMLVSFLQWFNGDLYATTWIVWLVLGIGDGYLSKSDDSVALSLSRPLPEPLVVPPNQGRWIKHSES